MSAGSKVQALSDARLKTFSSTPARERLAMLFDKDTFVELDGFAKVNSGAAGVVTGYGAIDGSPVYAFAQDSTEMGGAVGKIHAAKIKKVYDMALKTGSPIVAIYDSKGAKLDEGIDSLAAYSDILSWSNNLSGVVPQIAVVLGVCAGTAAMFAASADFVVMSENAELFLTAPDIAKSLGDTTEGAGTAANAAKSGVAHIVEKDEKAAIEKARKVISMLPLNNLSAAPIAEFAESDGIAEKLNAACESIAESDVKDIAASICDADSIVEMQAAFGCGAYTALATISGIPCGIAATNGKKLTADDCSKLARFVSICDTFSIPVVTLVNAPGFQPSSKAELAGSIREAAKLAHIYAEATTAKIAVIIGKAYGPAYITLAGRGANADLVYAWPSAEISALEPQAAVAFMHADKITAEKSREAVVAEYIENEASAYNAAAAGYIEDVIEPANTRNKLIQALDLLASKRVSRLPKKHSNIPM